MFNKLKRLYVKYMTYRKYKKLIKYYNNLFFTELKFGFLSDTTIHRLVLNILACSKYKDIMACKFKAEAKVLPKIVLKHM